MKQYLTELRRLHHGERWAGPIVEAHSLSEAKTLLALSPYRVIGELVATHRLDNGDIARFIQHGTRLVVH